MLSLILEDVLSRVADIRQIFFFLFLLLFLFIFGCLIHFLVCVFVILLFLGLF
jgi:hypothetical protein